MPKFQEKKFPMEEIIFEMLFLKFSNLFVTGNHHSWVFFFPFEKKKNV